MATSAYAIDETRNLTLVTAQGESREDTQYLWTPLDVIDPDRKHQLAHVERGGEEVASKCLRRSWCHNFVPRCTFTPLEKWFEPIGIAELIPDGIRPSTLKLADVPLVPEGMPPTQFFMRHQDPIGIPTYPGEDAPLIMQVAGYRGLTRVNSLFGKVWDSGDVQLIQEEFFPFDKPLPIALRLIEDRIKEVAKSGYPQLGDEMLKSCDTARRWARRRIDIEHTLLDTRTRHNHTYSYSAIASQLLAQLEMTPKDRGSETTALAEAIIKAMFDRQPQTQSVDVEAIVKAVLMAQQAVQTAAMPAAEAAEFACGMCGEKFDTAQGKNMHETRWCKNRPTE